jgi:hypothetical protein
VGGLWHDFVWGRGSRGMGMEVLRMCFWAVGLEVDDR